MAAFSHKLISKPSYIYLFSIGARYKKKVLFLEFFSLHPYCATADGKLTTTKNIQNSLTIILMVWPMGFLNLFPNITKTNNYYLCRVTFSISKTKQKVCKTRFHFMEQNQEIKMEKDANYLSDCPLNFRVLIQTPLLWEHLCPDGVIRIIILIIPWYVYCLMFIHIVSTFRWRHLLWWSISEIYLDYLLCTLLCHYQNINIQSSQA